MEGQLTLFIALTAVAILLQAGVLTAIYLSVARVEKDTRRLRQQLDQRIDPILSNLQEITDNARGLSIDARRQMDKFDKISDDVTGRLRNQITRLDVLLSQVLDTAEDAGVHVRDRVSGPMREAAAVLEGLKAALTKLNQRKSRRRGQENEEELFI